MSSVLFKLKPQPVRINLGALLPLRLERLAR